MNRRGGRGSRGRGTSSGDQNRVVENGQFNSNFVQSSRDDHQGGGNNNPRARSSSRGRGRVGNNLQQGQHPPRGPDPRGQQQHAARQHKQQQEIGGPGTDAFSQSSDVYRLVSLTCLSPIALYSLLTEDFKPRQDTSSKEKGACKHGSSQ